jgi:hypothetical protein
MSSRKRMHLNKTWLTDNRNPFFKDLPATNTNTNSLISYKKSKFLYTNIKEQKKHWWRARIIFLPKGDRIWAPHWAKRGWKVLLKHFQRSVRLEMLTHLYGLSTHQNRVLSSSRESFFYILTVSDQNHSNLNPRYTHSRGFFVFSLTLLFYMSSLYLPYV